MAADSSSDVESVFSDARLPTSAPSSPPPMRDPSELQDGGELSPELRRLAEEEEKARVENEKAEERRRAAALKKRRRKRAETKAEREAKARELDDLLRQSAAFSDILTKKTEVLGRVGSGFDGKALGEHNLQMAEQPRCMVGGTMRDYQLEGLTWMYEICLQGMSGILADEMGLGKTVQTISLIALLREQENYLGPHLIIAPLSTLSNWMDEFRRWTPSIPVVMYHGTPDQRSEIRTTKMMKHLQNGRPTDRFPVVCTSYEMVLRDRAALSKINWEFIIIDEGHRMKNFDSKLFRELRTFRSATRLLITGTPLQNNLKELWSLLNFLMPNIFANWDAFESWFDFSDLQDEEGTEEFIADQRKQDLVKKIHLILQPLLLRRVKADVASYLPKKREYVLFAPMTKEQTDLYNAISDATVDTRAYLESKVVERLTGSTIHSPAPSSRAASPEPPRPEAVGTSVALPVRSSPRGKAKTAAAAATEGPRLKNAFALMMGGGGGATKSARGRPAKPKAAAAPPAAPAAAPAEAGGKRKSPPTSERSLSKSTKSSRQSTPSSARNDRRRRRAQPTYRDSDASEDDLLDDDEFERKLAEQLAETKDADGAAAPHSAASAEESRRAKTLELAKKEIANKKLGNPLMQLRLVCNSPHNFYNPWASDAGAGPVDESIVTASGKMLLLDRLLPALFARGHRVLIFSQFKTQLDILEDYCRELRGWPVCRVDGGVAQDERRAQIAAFNAPGSDIRVFLLSTRAGGQGINLASADTVVLFDSDWNPQQDLQAQDRAHRIGQTRPVVVYRLATKGTVEEELLTSADAKRRLEKLVIKKGGFRTMGQKMAGRAGKEGGGGGGGGGEGDGADEDVLDSEALRALLLKDGLVYKFSGDKEILSDRDLEVLCDRSDEAYERAATGQGNAAAFKVVETGVDGITEAAHRPSA